VRGSWSGKKLFKSPKISFLCADDESEQVNGGRERGAGKALKTPLAKRDNPPSERRTSQRVERSGKSGRVETRTDQDRQEASRQVDPGVPTLLTKSV